MAMPKITTWNALEVPRRCIPAKASRQTLPALLPTCLLPLNNVWATRKPSPTVIAIEPISAPVSFQSLLYQSINSPSEAVPSIKSVERVASAMVSSRRITLSGDTPPKRASGGHAKNPIHTNAVTAPVT